MLFLAQKIRRKFDGSPTFVVLTDREELNTQISDTFENCGMLGNVKASKYIAQSGEDLIHKLKSNPSFIFTLIQKFNQKGLPPITPNYHHVRRSTPQPEWYFRGKYDGLAAYRFQNWFHRHAPVLQ